MSLTKKINKYFQKVSKKHKGCGKTNKKKNSNFFPNVNMLADNYILSSFLYLLNEK